MPKTTAPAWLREGFRDGVDERYGDVDHGGPRIHRAPAYVSAHGYCWLAQHDARMRPCEGRIERFHFIGRRRVRNALFALLPTESPPWSYGVPEAWFEVRAALIELAEWDARNGGIACEVHHRRFDAHLTPTLKVPQGAVPGHVHDFVNDWGLGHVLDDAFPILLA